MSSPVIDVHAHAHIRAVDALVGGEASVREIREAMAKRLGPEAAARNAEKMRQAGELLTNVDARMAKLDEMGVDMQLISPTPEHAATWAPLDKAREITQTVNDGMAAVCASRPDRLLGMGQVSIQHPEITAEQLTDAVRQYGLHGVQVAAAPPDRTLSDPAYDDFWSAAEELGALVLVHPALRDPREDAKSPTAKYFIGNIIGGPTGTTVALADMIFSGLLDRHPRVSVLGAHAGGYLPFAAGRADHAWRVRAECSIPEHAPSEYLRRIYFDSVTFEPTRLRHLVELVGADRVMVGSDFPFDMGPADPAADVRAAGLADDDVDAIIGATAAALLGIAAVSD